LGCGGIQKKVARYQIMIQQASISHFRKAQLV
jgi:hypothetical protein